MKRRLLIGCFTALVGSVVWAGWFWLDYRSLPRIVNGPMVQMLAPDGWTLVWDMHPSLAVTVAVSDGSSIVQQVAAQPVAGPRYEAAVAGLQPDHVYTYDIGPGLIQRTVRTAPAQPRPFRILAMGDTGDGERPQWLLSQLLPEWDPDLIVHTGDLIYPYGDIEDYPANFYRPYARLIDHVPFYPCFGNHDVMHGDGAALLATFILPRNGPPGEQPEREYWFDYADARFIALDSNLELETLRDRTAPWLDSVLAAAGSRWKFVFFHEPLYTHGAYDEAVKLKQSIGAILDRHHVNLVLCGHNHMYERTHPLRDGTIVPPGQGTVYLTTAAGGAGLYRFRPSPPPYMAAWDDTQHSFTIVDVSADLMRVRQIGQDQATIDDFHIPREKTATTSSVAQDTQNTAREKQPAIARHN